MKSLKQNQQLFTRASARWEDLVIARIIAKLARPIQELAQLIIYEVNESKVDYSESKQ